MAEGQFGDPPSEEFLSKAISQRRARILQTFLPAVNPVVDPVIRSNQLTFANAAVDAGVSPAPKGYPAAWSTFNNDTGQSSPIGTTEGTTNALSTPTLPASGFVKAHSAGASTAMPPTPSISTKPS